jgi:histidine ammonia-lyase
LDGQSLNLENLSKLGSGNANIKIADESWAKLQETRKVVDDLSAKDDPVYGINTGFGRFSNVKIPTDKLRELQYNLIRSHSTGVGKILPIDPSRRIVALRINTLAKGYSGISLDVVRRLVEYFNSGCVPWIPQAGSVGASGDLVPLAHIGLSVIGEGLSFNPKTQSYEPSEKVLKQFGLQKAELKAKDGLSLINGT